MSDRSDGASKYGKYAKDAKPRHDAQDSPLGLDVQSSEDLGLYIHIPYCAQLCHYCDFAKTANYDRSHVNRYFVVLDEHLRVWRAREKLRERKFTSLFFGGGTPGLFPQETSRLATRVAGLLRPGAEVTIECNPESVTEDSLKMWREAGVNRLSIGVQSFCQPGLSALTRLHTPTQAQQAVERALAMMPNVNIDLIYGWPGQRGTDLSEDVKQAIASGAPHISMYTLTYEPMTPIGRRQRRGRLRAIDDDLLADWYREICERVEHAGFGQEEVSNWARPGYQAVHNGLYWRDHGVLAVGSGAHGYLPDDGAGRRFRYTRNDRRFISAPWLETWEEIERDSDSWLVEYIGASLRSRYGLDLVRIERKSGRVFVPTPVVCDAIASGVIQRKQESLFLERHEWFRETMWCLELWDCFVSQARLSTASLDQAIIIR